MDRRGLACTPDQTAPSEGPGRRTVLTLLDKKRSARRPENRFSIFGPTRQAAWLEHGRPRPGNGARCPPASRHRLHRIDPKSGNGFGTHDATFSNRGTLSSVRPSCELAGVIRPLPLPGEPYFPGFAKSQDRYPPAIIPLQAACQIILPGMGQLFARRLGGVTVSTPENGVIRLPLVSDQVAASLIPAVTQINIPGG